MLRSGLAWAVRHGACSRAVLLLLSGLAIFVPALPVPAQEPPFDQQVIDARLASHIAEASTRFGIPEDWIRAVIAAESAHEISAVSSAGAMGLMQVMPATWTQLRARYAFADDPFDPRENILAGTAYLREMLDRYGNVGAMLAAYNAGPARYDEYLATGRSLPAETRDYVAALVPILGGTEVPVDTATAAPRPTDWREAPLFIAPSRVNSPAGAARHDGQSKEDFAPDSSQPDGGATSAGEGIFVARSAWSRGQ